MSPATSVTPAARSSRMPLRRPSTRAVEGAALLERDARERDDAVDEVLRARSNVALEMPTARTPRRLPCWPRVCRVTSPTPPRLTRAAAARRPASAAAAASRTGSSRAAGIPVVSETIRARRRRRRGRPRSRGAFQFAQDRAETVGSERGARDAPLGEQRAFHQARPLVRRGRVGHGLDHAMKGVWRDTSISGIPSRSHAATSAGGTRSTRMPTDTPERARRGRRGARRRRRPGRCAAGGTGRRR